MGPAAGRRLHLSGCPIFLKFFYFFFWKFEKWAMAFGRMGVQHPIFWSLPLHLEVLNLPFFMKIGDFNFFQILFFLNLGYIWTFISTVGIFVSWKIEITKNSARFSSVMEIFCTLLQCKVHLSMFHLSSTSKIW
jgi:hypothetical protein